MQHEKYTCQNMMYQMLTCSLLLVMLSVDGYGAVFVISQDLCLVDQLLLVYESFGPAFAGSIVKV